MCVYFRALSETSVFRKELILLQATLEERERERGAAMYVAAVVACVVTAGPDAVQEKALLAMLFVKLSS